MEENARLIRELRQTLESVAQPLEVIPEIHPDDFIFDFLVHNPVFESVEAAVGYYFTDGASSAKKLRALLSDVCKLGNVPFSLLEFASGFGCVSRHLVNAIPSCELTASDIHPEAIRFLRNVLGVDAIPSTASPEDFPAEKTFNVVFALSFFSHMPKPTFTRWIRTLVHLLNDQGFLLFTTHGFASRKYFPHCEFDADGFFFDPSSEQKDLSPTEYGTSVVTPGYVFSQIFTFPDCHILYFHEGFWWEHQDLYILRKGDPI